MVIKNYNELATTQLRIDALAILEAGYKAIETEAVVDAHVALLGDTLTIAGKAYDLKTYKQVFLVGIGKCAADGARAIERVLGPRLSGGIIVDVRGSTLGRVQSFQGTHPLPSKENVRAAESVKELLVQATEDDLIITIISGGGSALLCLPHDMSCETLARITKALMMKGATIEELNTVRKHLSDILGGQFAKLAYPAHIVSLIFSDVPGDDISTIASGPTVRDTTTQEDAERILAKYEVITMCVIPHCVVTETPKEEKWFEFVDNVLVLTNMIALKAMKDVAEARGYVAEIRSNKMTGEAREVGEQLSREAHAPHSVLLYGGETTVVLRGNGKGGRNQEVVLGGIAHLEKSTVLVAAASDGWDNGSVAGAMADSALFERSKNEGVDVASFLNENNAYEFFSRVGGHIVTGQRGTNISDLYFTITE